MKMLPGSVTMNARLRDGRLFATASSASTPVINLPITTQSLEARLVEVATPIPRAERENTFDRLADKPVLKERPPMRIRTTQPHSSARLEDTMRDQFANIPAVV